MEATDREDLVEDADHHVVPPTGGMNELLDVGHEDNMEGQVSSQVEWQQNLSHLTLWISASK